MPNFKEFNELRSVPVTEEELKQFLESPVWLAFCQITRVKQRQIYGGIRSMVDVGMRSLMYAHIDQLDDVLAVPSIIREQNIVVETPEIKDAILASVRGQLKGDIEQWKPKQ